MPHFVVSSRGIPSVTVDAGNWLTALGIGLDELGVVGGLDRLACEVLMNGTVIARDARSGTGYIVTEGKGEARPETSPGFAPSPGGASGGYDEDEEPTVMLEVESSELALALADGVEDYDDEEDTEELGRKLVTTLLSTILEAGNALQAWEQALRVVQELAPAESGAALRLEPDGQLRFVAATGPKSHGVVGVFLPRETGLVGFCVARQVGLVVTCPHRDSRFFGEMDRVTGYATKNVLCVPVRALGGAGHVWGCLELLNAEPGFGRAHLEVADEVAAALAQRLAAD